MPLIHQLTTLTLYCTRWLCVDNFDLSIFCDELCSIGVYPLTFVHKLQIAANAANWANAKKAKGKAGKDARHEAATYRSAALLLGCL